MPEALVQTGSYNAPFRQELCRPINGETAPSIEYKRYFPGKEFTISIRLLYTVTDMPFVFDWVNHTYAKHFWQKDNQPIEQLKETCQLMLACDFAQPFIALLNDDPVCQVDVYKTLQDEVSLLYSARPGDYGLRFLMAPRKEHIPNLSVCVLRTFMEFFFFYPEVKRIITEPDAEDVQANNLVKKAGFRFMHAIAMPYRAAHLYCFTKEDLGAGMLSY
jgi:hypothetical protein